MGVEAMNAARITRRFVAYYRVSTRAASGLGLEAQQKAVRDYLSGGAWEIAGEFVEVESGKRADRPELAKALETCRKHSRNLAFIATSMGQGPNLLQSITLRALWNAWARR
jgi:hypothetical protein